MAEGTIKKLVPDRGFGFIKTDGEDIFFHSTCVQETTFEALEEGQKVEFSSSQGPKGPKADSVRPA